MHTTKTSQKRMQLLLKLRQIILQSASHERQMESEIGAANNANRLCADMLNMEIKRNAYSNKFSFSIFDIPVRISALYLQLKSLSFII